MAMSIFNPSLSDFFSLYHWHPANENIYTYLKLIFLKMPTNSTTPPPSSPTHSTTHLSSATLTHTHSPNPPACSKLLQKLLPLFRVSQPSSPLKEFQFLLSQAALPRISCLHSSFCNLVYLSTTTCTYHLRLASVCTCLCNHFQKEPLPARAQGLHVSILAL